LTRTESLSRLSKSLICGEYMTIKRFLGEDELSADAIDVSGYGALQITDLLTSPSTASHHRGVGIVSHSEDARQLWSISL